MRSKELELELMDSANRAAEQAVLTFEPPFTDDLIMQLTQTYAEALRDGFDECGVFPDPELIADVSRHFAARVWRFSDIAWKVQQSEVPS